MNKTAVEQFQGTELHTRWLQEAALRMLNNNLNPEVAENPDELVVYGGIGKAARNWDSYHAIVKELKQLENDETLLIQSGKPVVVFKKLMKMHRESCWQTPIWFPLGRTGSILMS